MMRNFIIKFLTARYHWVIDRTTDRPWTYIMRDNPLYLYIPGFAIVIGLIITDAPRWIEVPYDIFFGIIIGHVRWGRQNPKVEEDHKDH